MENSEQSAHNEAQATDNAEVSGFSEPGATETRARSNG